MNVSKFTHGTKLYLRKSGPTILSCMAVIGMVTTVVMGVQVTPKAIKLIKNDSRMNHDGDSYGYTKMEALQSSWKCYIPTTLVGVSTIACIFGANVMNKRSQASLASAYALLDRYYKQYIEAVKDIYGGDADSNIKAQIAKNSYVSADGYYLYDCENDDDKILFYDLFSNRYFTATMASVLNAQYHINRNICLRGYASINEFYEFLGIDKVDYGDDICWDMNDMSEDGIMWLDFDNSRVDLEDGMECCIISALYNPTQTRIGD